MIRHVACIALAMAGTLQAAGHHSRSEGAPDVFAPIPFDEQRLAGTLAQRMRANVEGYLQQVDASELLKAPVSAGLFLIAASDSYAYNEDPNLRKSMDSVAKAIVRNTPETDDPLAQAALISGLIAYSEETGEDEPLSAARKIANAQLSNASPTLIGPLTALYRVTADDGYVRAAESLSRKAPPEDKLQRLVYASGLVTYYRESGDESALKKSIRLWSSVHPNIAGAPDSDGSTCATAAWFDWTTNLLRATGKAQYADAAETTLYNQLLAGQSTQSGAIFGSVTLAGTKTQAAATDPCAAAEGWALAGLPEALWGRMENGIAILNYTAGRASFRLRRRTTVQIYAEGDYPQTGDIVLHVEPSRQTRFHLLLRVPKWSTGFVAEGLGNHLTGKPGEFIDFAAEWKKGDIVRITMQLPVITQHDPQQAVMLALQRGPQLLAVTASSGQDLGGLSWASNAASAVKPVAEQVFTTSGVEDGRPASLSLMPFANASGSYRVWLPQH